MQRGAIVGSLLALGPILAACQAAAPAPTTAPAKPPEAPKQAAVAPTAAAGAKPAGQTVELRIHTNQSDAWSGIQQKAYDDDVLGFKSKNPSITVKLEPVPSADYVQKMLALASAGQLGDIAWHAPRWGTQVGWATKYKIIQPLDELAKAANFDPKKEFLEAAVAASTWEGKLYYFNFIGEPTTPLIAYNKTQIEKTGQKVLENGHTFDELAEWAKKVTTPNHFAYCHGHRSSFIGVIPYLRQWGVDVADAAGKKITISETKEQMTNALKFVYDLVNTWKVSPALQATANMDEPFVAEKYLAVPIWPVYANRYPKVLVKDKFECAFSLTSLVKKGEKLRSNLNEHVMGITTASKNPREAFQYLDWVTTPEFGLLAVETGMGAPNARKALWNDERLYKAIPGYQMMRDLMMNIEPDFKLANFRGLELADAWQQNYDKLVLNQVKPEQAVADIQTAFQAVADKPAG
jgi:multiple sugar transport system substrate-binding protein